MISDMLRKNIIATLSLVFVFVTVTNGTPTEDQVQIEFEHNVDSNEKQFAVDGHLYNPNPTAGGPSTRDISPRQDFGYLGYFNGKRWYIERTRVAYTTAVQNCTNMGMELAKVDQAELNFLYTVTGGGDDYSWLGGKLAVTIDAFRWADGTTPSGVSLDTYSSMGLTLSRYSTTSKLCPISTDSVRYYICVI